jgi:hypothetical protein
MSERQTFVVEDHLCKDCGGRILRCVTGNGMMPGGPLFYCPDCGARAWGLSASVLCWCGQKHKHNNMTAYVCRPFSILEERPYLKELFLECGCDPTRGEVGIMIEKRYYDLCREYPVDDKK